jgi:hypothetical protein
MNYWLGPTSGKTFTLITGKEDPTEAGTIYKIDNWSWALLNDKLWDGYEWSSCRWYNDKVSDSD